MSNATMHQLESIHAMLAAGHRSIRIERHSLVLWGVTGALLALGTDLVITPQRFPDPWQLALAVLLFLGLTLSAVAMLDIFYTRQTISARNESFSFVHAQITKVWWLLMGLGVLLTFGMMLFGGGYMVFAVWLALFGLGLYVHGLFSEQILEWVGALMIALGVGAVGLTAPPEMTKWLAASVFGLGMPVLSLMLDRGSNKTITKRLGQTAMWLALVLAPPVLALQFFDIHPPPRAPTVPLLQFMRQHDVPKMQVVSIPAGTSIPIKLNLSGNIFREATYTSATLVLARPIEVVLENGEPDGRYRVASGQWGRAPGLLRVTQLGTRLTTTEGPFVTITASVTHGKGE